MKNNSILYLRKGFLTMPVAVVLAAVIIGVAIIYAVGQKSTAPVVAEDDNAADSGTALVVERIKPIAAQDHIRGSADAPVKVVEFSDTECPFCKRFHDTMKQVVADYNGQVAWVYRHFPLDSLHSKARKEAQATECAAELGGNDKFWAYLDRLFEVTPSNDGLDLGELSNVAEYVGLDRNAFNACLQNGKHAPKIEAQYQDGIASGAQGTPYSVVISSSGKKTTINGAYPISAVKQVIDKSLAEK